jgi:cell division septum initiation protein DivIVA
MDDAPAFAASSDGYDRAQVDAYVADLREQLTQARAAAPDQRRFGQEVGALLQQAQEVAQRHVQRAEREAEERAAATHAAADLLLRQARRHAEEQAEAILRRAEADADRLLRESRREARVVTERQEAHRREYERALAELEERHRTLSALLARLDAALEAEDALDLQRPQVPVNDDAA